MCDTKQERGREAGRESASGRDLFEELTHTIMENGLKSAGWAGGLETRGSLNVAVLSLKAIWRQISLFSGEL